MSGVSGVKVGPHEYEPISLLDRIIGAGGRCRACYKPKCAHPVRGWADARHMGSSALDYEWSHMNAVERTEALKRRLDRMERPVYVVRAGGDDPRELNLMPGRFVSVVEAPPTESIPSAELARLRRIEEAVDRFILALDADRMELSWSGEGPIIGAIREALKR